MKLDHYRMMDAFQTKNVGAICSIFEDHFGISLSGISAEVIRRDHYAGNEIVLFMGNGHYYWSESEGFFSGKFIDPFPIMLRINFMVTT